MIRGRPGRAPPGYRIPGPGTAPRKRPIGGASWMEPGSSTVATPSPSSALMAVAMRMAVPRSGERSRSRVGPVERRCAVSIWSSPPAGTAAASPPGTAPRTAAPSLSTMAPWAVAVGSDPGPGMSGRGPELSAPERHRIAHGGHAHVETTARPQVRRELGGHQDRGDVAGPQHLRGDLDAEPPQQVGHGGARSAGSPRVQRPDRPCRRVPRRGRSP